MNVPNTDHYYDGQKMPIIKHGFVKEGDAFPDWWENAQLALANNNVSVEFEWIETGVSKVKKNYRVSSLEMVGNRIKIEYLMKRLFNVVECKDGTKKDYEVYHNYEALPIQITVVDNTQYEFKSEDELIEVPKYTFIIKDEEQCIKEYMNSFSDLLETLEREHKEFNFHPIKSPKTIKLIKDLTQHLLDPMSVDCPNENMQQGIQEIVWHMNNHIAKGDYFLLFDRFASKVKKCEVLNFASDSATIFYKLIDDVKERQLMIRLADTNNEILKYFGIEKWAYKDKDTALKAMYDYLEKLEEKYEWRN